MLTGMMRSRIVQDFFQLFAQGEGKIRLNGLLGVFGGMLPQDFGPSDAIWWNQGLFSPKHILSFFVSLKLF